jgi:hypothetical protein
MARSAREATHKISKETMNSHIQTGTDHDLPIEVAYCWLHSRKDDMAQLTVIHGIIMMYNLSYRSYNPINPFITVKGHNCMG